MTLIPVVSGGPSWTDIMTAFGTVGAVIAAVGIALWTEWRSGKWLNEQREHSDQQLEAEHARGDRLLAEERAREREREQLGEANAVQVVYAEPMMGALDIASGVLRRAEPDAVLVMINHGKYTITGIGARWVFRGGRTEEFAGWERLSRMEDMDPRLLVGVSDRLEVLRDTHRLSPWDLGLRISSGPMEDAVPIVRWTDRWGTRWEHRRGEVRQVRDGEDWVPLRGSASCPAA